MTILPVEGRYIKSRKMVSHFGGMEYKCHNDDDHKVKETSSFSE